MEIMQIEAFNIIGITVRTDNNDLAKVTADMQGLWGKFMSEGVMDKIPNKLDTDICCIYTDYEGDYTKPYTALLGCRVSSLEQIPDGLAGYRFDGGKYVRKPVSGNLLAGAVYNAWQEIWNSDLERSYIADLEIYGVKAANPEAAELEILVGIK